MAERFILNNHGEPIPYDAVQEPARRLYIRPEPKFRAGDQVILQGVVVETQHLQGESYNVRLTIGDQQIWIEQRFLTEVQEYEAAQLTKFQAAQITAEAADRSARKPRTTATKALDAPPVTRAILEPDEAK